jgi:hypothetical protein
VETVSTPGKGRSASKLVKVRAQCQTHTIKAVAAVVPKPAPPARSSRKPQIKNFVLPVDVVRLGNAFITEYFDATDRSVSWSALVEVALRELVKRDDRIDVLSEYKVRARRPSVQ